LIKNSKIAARIKTGTKTGTGEIIVETEIQTKGTRIIPIGRTPINRITGKDEDLF
jgi:hypothetical protein